MSVLAMTRVECRNSVKSVQCRCKNLLRPKMHRQRLLPKEDTKKLAIAVRVLQNT